MTQNGVVSAIAIVLALSFFWGSQEAIADEYMNVNFGKDIQSKMDMNMNGTHYTCTISGQMTGHEILDGSRSPPVPFHKFVGCPIIIIGKLETEKSLQLWRDNEPVSVRIARTDHNMLWPSENSNGFMMIKIARDVAIKPASQAINIRWEFPTKGMIFSDSDANYQTTKENAWVLFTPSGPQMDGVKRSPTEK